MKKLSIIVAVLACVGAGGYYGFFNEAKETVSFKTAKVEKRDVVKTIDATGTVEPEDLVDVAARVSGEIIAFGKDKDGREVDYGSEICEGDVIALIDDQIQQSNYLSANAKLEAAKAAQSQANANIIVAQTNLRQAERDWKRAQRLGASEALSQASYDSYLAAWEKATAEIDVAKAKILQSNADVVQAEANMKEAKRNLEYCIIKAPVNGVVIDRKVNVGQTVVSNMSASSLFSIAKDLRKMEVWASVNEADIGGIRKGQSVSFTVDAFPREKFAGKVGKIRLNATMSQNVVTYVVEVATDNSSLRLLPYLSANLSFEVDRRDNALAVPNAALRFRPDEKYLADGTEIPEGRCLWILGADGKLSPVKVKTLVGDGAWTAVESPNISAGMEIVTGVETMSAKKSATSTPFMPKVPQRRKGNAPVQKK